MRVKPLIVPLSLLPALLLAARDSSAMGGIEGTFEYAIDAPWRIEPVVDGAGHATYGAIPIQLTIHDENVIAYDSFGAPPPGPRSIWIARYGFSNPVWAISPPNPAGSCPKNKPRAVDSDNDGLPDGCDPCPNNPGPVCRPTVNGGGMRQ